MGRTGFIAKACTMCATGTMVGFVLCAAGTAWPFCAARYHGGLFTAQIPGAASLPLTHMCGLRVPACPLYFGLGL